MSMTYLPALVATWEAPGLGGYGITAKQGLLDDVAIAKHSMEI
jgi:hypothetical protein